MRAIVGGAVIVAWVATASAQEARFFRCDPPQGKRVDYGDLQALDGKLLRRFDDGPDWSDDAYSGVRPVVVIDRGSMLVSLGKRSAVSGTASQTSNGKARITPPTRAQITCRG